MPLDKIVVFILAILFFGGLAFIIWKGKQQGNTDPAAPQAVEPIAAKENPPSKPREKRRRSSRN